MGKVSRVAARNRVGVPYIGKTLLREQETLLDGAHEFLPGLFPLEVRTIGMGKTFATMLLA
jgi:hypothetical protein